MHKTRLIAILLVAALFAACRHDTFTLSGTISGGAGHTLYLEEISPEGPIFIDSIPINKKGHFSFTYHMPYRSLYNLHATKDNFVVLLPDYGEELTVSAQWPNLSTTYTVTGSAESSLLWQLQMFSNDGSRIISDLVDTTIHYSELLSQHIITDIDANNKKLETDSIFRLAWQEQQDYVCRFIEENSGSLSTLIALYKPFNNRLLIDQRDPNCIDYYDLVLDGLRERYPDNPHTLHFKNTTEHLRSTLQQ